MRIAIDIDGVVRDWVGKVQEVYKRHYPDHWTKEVTEWSMSPFFELGKGINDFIWADAANTREIYEEANPYEHAIENVRHLIAAGHSVFFLTSQPTNVAKRSTDIWVHLLFPGVDVVYALDQDSKPNYEADVYVDDNPAVLKAVAEKRPKAIRVCIARPWNADYVGNRMTLTQFVNKIWSEG